MKIQNAEKLLEIDGVKTVTIRHDDDMSRIEANILFDDGSILWANRQGGAESFVVTGYTGQSRTGAAKKFEQVNGEGGFL